ncbi:MAG: hypothetical protein ABIZ18_03945 [Caldimonas sp.]
MKEIDAHEPLLTLRMSYGEGFRPPALCDMYGRTEIRLGAVLRIVDAAPLLEHPIRRRPSSASPATPAKRTSTGWNPNCIGRRWCRAWAPSVR